MIDELAGLISKTKNHVKRRVKEKAKTVVTDTVNKAIFEDEKTDKELDKIITIVGVAAITTTAVVLITNRKTTIINNYYFPSQILHSV